jgi:protein SCO1/2
MLRDEDLFSTCLDSAINAGYNEHKIIMTVSGGLAMRVFFSVSKNPGESMNKNKRLPVGIILIAFIFLSSMGAAQGAEKPDYKKSIHNYVMPDVTLVNQLGKKVQFKNIVKQGKVVILDFIFGTCTTICPVLSASFVSFQSRLGAESGKVHLVSISIDPEHDTPKVLREYLKTFRAKPSWDFLTGNRDSINRVMRAFDAFTADKMAHFPLTFVYSPAQDKWFRIDGLTGTSELMYEYKEALKR